MQRFWIIFSILFISFPLFSKYQNITGKGSIVMPNDDVSYGNTKFNQYDRPYFKIKKLSELTPIKIKEHNQGKIRIKNFEELMDKKMISALNKIQKINEQDLLNSFKKCDVDQDKKNINCDLHSYNQIDNSDTRVELMNRFIEQRKLDRDDAINEIRYSLRNGEISNYIFKKTNSFNLNDKKVIGLFNGCEMFRSFIYCKGQLTERYYFKMIKS
jgi:hypothetical protein